MLAPNIATVAVPTIDEMLLFGGHSAGADDVIIDYSLFATLLLC